MEITIELIVFAIFAIITLAGALGVVMAHNLFRAALLLLVSLFGVAGMFVLLAAPFLAAAQVLIYMGGIAILIIFAVMLTRGMITTRQVFNSQWSVAVLAAVLLFAVLALMIVDIGQGDDAPLASDAVAEIVGDSTAELGTALVSPEQYVLPFELAALLLAGALVGAIYIARDEEAE